MKVIVKIGKEWILVDNAIPCGQGDTIEVRDGKAKGFHTGRGKKWKKINNTRKSNANI